MIGEAGAGGATPSSPVGSDPPMRALFFGEILMDLLIHMVPAPPTVKSIRGDRFDTVPGGRAANQAVAARRLGAHAVLVGRVGGDTFGWSLLEHLREADVDIAGVDVDEENTGLMVLGIDQDGDYVPVAKVPGVNDRLGNADVARFSQLAIGGAVAFFQFGIPEAALIGAAQAAKRLGLLTILDPTPVPARIDPDLAAAIDVVTPNQREVHLILGLEVTDAASAQVACNVLHEQGLPTVVVKMGARGAHCSTLGGSGIGAAEAFLTPAYAVTPVDTVGAGDAFNAALGIALAQGAPLRQAVLQATAAGALAVTRRGAQSALPDRDTLLSFMARHTPAA